MDCQSSEQFRSREHDDISRGKTESASERTLDEVQALDHAAHDFAETFDLAFGLKINEDPGVAGAPLFQLLDELCAFRLREHEIAGTKFSNVAILKRAAEVFRTRFDPAFADLNVRIRNWVRLNIYGQIALANVIARRSALIASSVGEQ